MQLEVKNQEALKKTTWDFGKTSVFTGGEELNGNNEGVKNIIGVRYKNAKVVQYKNGQRINLVSAK